MTTNECNTVKKNNNKRKTQPTMVDALCTQRRLDLNKQFSQKLEN